MLKLLTILLSGSPFRWWTRQQVTAGLIPQQSQLKRSMSPARRPFRAISARIVELAGINQFQMFATVNIKKLLDLTSQSCNTRERALGSLPAKGALNSDQVISCVMTKRRLTSGRAPGPAIWFFQDHQWKQRHDPSYKRQATSTKHHAPIFRKQQASIKLQAASVKLSNQPVQSPSDKHPIPNNKRQASSPE